MKGTLGSSDGVPIIIMLCVCGSSAATAFSLAVRRNDPAQVRAIERSRHFIGTAPLFIGTAPLFIGTAPLFIGTAPLFIGTAPLFIGTAPLFIGTAPLFIGTAPLFIGTAPLFIGTAPLFIGTAPLFHLIVQHGRTGSREAVNRSRSKCLG